MRAKVVSKSAVKNQKSVLVVKSDVKAGPDFIVKK